MPFFNCDCGTFLFVLSFLPPVSEDELECCCVDEDDLFWDDFVLLPPAIRFLRPLDNFVADADAEDWEAMLVEVTLSSSSCAIFFLLLLILYIYVVMHQSSMHQLNYNIIYVCVYI